MTFAEQCVTRFKAAGRMVPAHLDWVEAEMLAEPRDEVRIANRKRKAEADEAAHRAAARSKAKQRPATHAYSGSGSDDYEPGMCEVDRFTDDHDPSGS